MENIDKSKRSAFKGILTSSDFVKVAHDFYRMRDPELFEKIDPVYCWEKNNHDSSNESNVAYIESKLQGLDLSDYIEVEKSYAVLLDLFLEDEVLSKLFPMNSKDTVGWNIWRQLADKMELARKYFNVTRYNHQKENDAYQATTQAN
jgi:hypothetical protein